MNLSTNLGNEIRIVAPSGSRRPKRAAHYARARKQLEDMGLAVSFGDHVSTIERFGTGSVADRVSDLHAAYRDSNVRFIMAMHGGWSANALLPGIDWPLLAANPKPLIGFSDITVLVNAIYAKTGSINYLGPNFSSLGARHTTEYTVENLQKVLFGTDVLALQRSHYWQRKRTESPSRTRPWKILQYGEGEGVLIGGNIGTFYLLQGTPYQPRLDQPFILAVEDDDEAGLTSAREFDRRLESLLQLPGARTNAQGVIIGRFQPSSGVTIPDVAYIIERLQLKGIPVIADVDFGHTAPLLTLPIGGRVQINTKDKRPQLNLLKY